MKYLFSRKKKSTYTISPQKYTYKYGMESLMHLFLNERNTAIYFFQLLISVLQKDSYMPSSIPIS